jgi:AcrR family transcriptional regulator
MVITPWGESDALRERQLHPVRGMPSAEVERNQRERLLAAMVASVAEKGFADTTVNDLVERSGVSSRSFYDYFGEKSTCFHVTIAEILKLARIGAVEGEEEEGLEEAARRHLGAFARAVIAQPAAAKVCLTDSFAGGEAAAVERRIGTFERELRGRCADSPERKGMPKEVLAARVGGVLEVARTKLREGKEAEMGRLSGDLADLLLADRPPPRPLRLGVRPGKAAPEGLEAPDHAERAIRAFALLVSEQGYHESSIDDVVKRASMSARTFYGIFNGKEDLMLSAIDSACAQIAAAMMPAFARYSEWPDGIRAGYGAMLGFLASRPALAHLVAVEVYVAGDFAIERRNAGMGPPRVLLVNNTTSWAAMPPVVYEATEGGVWRLIYKTMVRSGPQALPALAPICTYITLSPFLGPEKACEVANGARQRPAGAAANRSWTPIGREETVALRTPVRLTVWKALSQLVENSIVAGEEGDGLSPAAVAAHVDEKVEVVRCYLRELATAGVLEAEERSEGEEPLYRSVSALHKLQLVSNRQTEEMSLAERGDLSTEVWKLIADDLAESMASGVFDQRPERQLTRVPLQIDEQGWREVLDLHMQLLQATFEVSARAIERLEESGERPMRVRSVQAVFEMPTREGDADGPPSSPS